MKKQLAMTTAMAAALVTLPGCSSSNDWEDATSYADSDTAICVDQEGRRIDDDQCDDDRHGHRSGLSSGFLWYYIGRNSAVPYYGDSVRQRGVVGSYSPKQGVNYARAPAATRMTRSQAISRGGLGSSSRSFGSGRS